MPKNSTAKTRGSKLLQKIKILAGIPKRAFRNEIHNLKIITRDGFCICVRLIAAIWIASRFVIGAYHEAIRSELLFFYRIQNRQVIFSMSCQDQMSARPEDPEKFLQPFPLQRFRQMSQYRQSVNQIELMLTEDQWRLQIILSKRSES